MPTVPTSVLLFLGSGASRPSGMDGVRELTNGVLADPLVFVGADEFVPSRAGMVPMPGYERVAAVTQGFLRVLKAYADRYYAVRNRQESNYEDIFYLARQIGDDRLGEIDNPAVDGFIREVREQCEPFLPHLVDVATGDRYPVLVRRACRLIQSVVARRLATPAKIVGFDFVDEVARDPALKLFDVATLNHDLITETYLRAAGHTVVDGFDTADGDVRRFNPARYDAGGGIRLLKLHGSIDWYRYMEKDSTDWFAIPVSGDPSHAKDGVGTLLSVADGPHFLAGTINKVLDYGSGIFAEQFYRFHQFLKTHDLVVVSGYGFNDKGVNGRLWDWLFEKPTRRMVVLHAYPDQLFAHARGSFVNAYHRLSTDRRLIIVEKWMQSATWRGDVLPQLT
jgi:hypothetical protein